MVVLELGFPAGRYHATPWGRHVNEGTVEWPPSPWRIIRALIATWHLKAREIPETAVRSLVETLSRPPKFHLPHAATSHTRHYMPYNEGKNVKTTKVFDTFVQLEPGKSILAAWEAELSPDQQAVLGLLASRLGYFGRAEGIVVARLLEGVTDIEANAVPLAEGEPLPEGMELVRLLAPMSPTEYSAWREDFLAKQEAALGPRPTAAQRRKLPSVPPDLFAALHAETGELHAAGWNLPPGSRFVNYTRPEHAFASAPRPRTRRKQPLPTVARYALASTVPPSITKAMAVGEQIHTVLCKESNGHPIFTGAGSQGHRHAHVFCESIGDNNAHITHVTIFAPGGFDGKAVEALRSLQWTWGFDRHELRLVLHGIGNPADFADCELFARSQTWRSLTPFVSTRHAKTFRDGRPKLAENGWQEGSAPHDLLRLLAMHPQGADARIRWLNEASMPYRFGGRRFRSLQFVTRRHSGQGSRGNGSGNAFILLFPQPVDGPLALGYGCHFGLGLFGPAKIESEDAPQLPV